jgi:hypothetical protein
VLVKLTVNTPDAADVPLLASVVVGVVGATHIAVVGLDTDADNVAG